MTTDLAALIGAQAIDPPDLDTDELVADTVVLLRTIDTDGGERLYLAGTAGQSRYTRMGMLQDALDGLRDLGWTSESDA